MVLFASCNQTKTYCGKVTDKYLLAKNNGGVYNIVFYCDSLKKNVNVSVTADTYVNTSIGEHVCFDLDEYQLNH